MAQYKDACPNRRGARKPTSDDVARAAGVSQSTVSYVLTGRRPISEATRRKVEKAIVDLGFVPNIGARALAGNRSQVVGLVIPLRRGLELGTNMEFVAAIASIAREHDHDVLLATADEGPAGLERLRDNGLCDGLILMDVESDDPRVAAARELGMPCVIIGVPDARHGLACVDLDFEAAGSEAIALLAARGHRRVGLISPGAEGGRRGMSFSRRFLAGARAAAAGRVELCQVESSDDYVSLEAATRSIYTAAPDCTAIVVHLSAAVEPELVVLQNLGLRPGADVDVVGICSAAVAAKHRHELDALLLQPDAVSRRAVEVLFGNLDRTPSAALDPLVLIPAPVLPRKGAPVV